MKVYADLSIDCLSYLLTSSSTVNQYPEGLFFHSLFGIKKENRFVVIEEQEVKFEVKGSNFEKYGRAECPFTLVALAALRFCLRDSENIYSCPGHSNVFT